jgi:WXG100 family type VII secretion target
MGVNPGNMMQGDSDTMRQAAATATSVAGSVDGHRAKMQGMVADAMPQWSGTAGPACARATDAWAEGVRQLVTALRNLGDGVQVTAGNYDMTEMDNTTSMNSVQSMGAFGNQLRA